MSRLRVFDETDPATPRFVSGRKQLQTQHAAYNTVIAEGVVQSTADVHRHHP
jgi:hypothetical protein